MITPTYPLIKFPTFLYQNATRRSPLIHKSKLPRVESFLILVQEKYIIYTDSSNLFITKSVTLLKSQIQTPTINKYPESKKKISN